jgi:hypothetical protein
MDSTRIKNIYISADDEKTWAEIHAEADAEKRGVGYFICRLFERERQRGAVK